MTAKGSNPHTSDSDSPVHAAVNYCRENRADLRLIGFVKDNLSDTTTVIAGERIRRSRRIRDTASRAQQRTFGDWWPSLQATTAATVAWVIAKNIFDHHVPFFAPIAALVALNTSLGERGINAVRLLQGVVAGIIVGEVTIAALGEGYGALALATFVAMAAARTLGGSRIVIVQAAIGAILTVTYADAEVGTQRLSDALLGAGVALVFSQLLFSPEPVALLRRAEATVLSSMADGLALTARGLEDADENAAEAAINRLRALRDDLAELGRMRKASTRVARRTLVWRSQRAPVVHESENADHLDLLGMSCLALARAAVNADPSDGQT
jgi:uncharacterized membrane protein YgaE (UPF0421/DUF939 family)